MSQTRSAHGSRTVACGPRRAGRSRQGCTSATPATTRHASTSITCSWEHRKTTAAMPWRRAASVRVNGAGVAIKSGQQSGQMGLGAAWHATDFTLRAGEPTSRNRGLSWRQLREGIPRRAPGCRPRGSVRAARAPHACVPEPAPAFPSSLCELVPRPRGRLTTNQSFTACPICATCLRLCTYALRALAFREGRCTAMRANGTSDCAARRSAECRSHRIAADPLFRGRRARVLAGLRAHPQSPHPPAGSTSLARPVARRSHPPTYPSVLSA